MKKLLLLVIVALVLFAGFTYFTPPSKQPKQISQIKKARSLTAQQKILKTRNDSASYNSYQLVEGKTALDLLQKTAAVVTKGQKENAFVVEINGKKAEEKNKEYWAFYINGKLSAVGAGSYKLKNGDKIEWKIENY